MKTLLELNLVFFISGKVELQDKNIGKVTGLFYIWND